MQTLQRFNSFPLEVVGTMLKESASLTIEGNGYYTSPQFVYQIVVLVSGKPIVQTTSAKMLIDVPI